MCALVLLLIFSLLFVGGDSVAADPHHDACVSGLIAALEGLEDQGRYDQLKQTVEIHKTSPALADPLIEEGRNLAVVDDFKTLSDMSPRPLSAGQIAQVRKNAAAIEAKGGRKDAVSYLIHSLYEHKDELLPVDSPLTKPLWTVVSAIHRATFDHIERMWSKLIRRTPTHTDSSLIPLPYPLLIPGARFNEGYYWDTFFAIPALLRSGQAPIVKGQIENFLFLLRNYGIIPNGSRTYYLTRSQPPFLSQMIRKYVENEEKRGPLSEETKKWLREEVLPLVRSDYDNFWMNKATRLDKKTGLNHHWDSENSPRPERHATDKEATLSKTYRDTRAEAESGKDFTEAFGRQASDHAGVMLNSVLGQVEKDIGWMMRITGDEKSALIYDAAYKKRVQAMTKYMWDDRNKTFKDYNLKTAKQSSLVTADIFTTLLMNIATPEQAKEMVAKQLPRLERAGGLMSSAAETGKQWDGPFGWAPHHYFAIQGLLNYQGKVDGAKIAAERLAQKWVDSVDRIYKKTGKIIEKIDAKTGDLPIEAGDKYPTQDGFLWSNGVYSWALTDVLGVRMERLPPEPGIVKKVLGIPGLAAPIQLMPKKDSDDSR